MVGDADICGQQHYAKGSAQRAGLNAALESLQKKGALEVPLVIGGKEVR
jgi:1-pyrroline-5-carboxylate dehydrogenase